MTTGVTCPTIRIHPAILAQAAATAALLLEGRFLFGVGTGENLNEHVLGDHWPRVDTRLEMLEEAVEVMRKLWEGGLTSHDGRYYQVENARMYSLPDTPPPVLVSAFGPKAASLAARIGDGYISTAPDKEALDSYVAQGGKRAQAAAGMKVCWAGTRRPPARPPPSCGPTRGVPGELSQELALPEPLRAGLPAGHRGQARAEKIACGPDPERHLESIRQYVDAGFDEVYVSQIGNDQAGFFEFYRRELAPRLS